MRLKLDEKRWHQYDDPGPSRDRLFEDSYEQKGTELDDCKECCDADYTLSRFDRGDGANRSLDEPAVHFGNIASSNKLRISAVERNGTQKEHEAIYFEMDGCPRGRDSAREASMVGGDLESVPTDRDANLPTVSLRNSQSLGYPCKL
ncbi:hypothetical protein PSPO01_15831 [Paraphaeosphaeria sporulosa]